MKTYDIDHVGVHRQALVLGARPGNIGGAIVERLDDGSEGWNVYGDDCLVEGTTRYAAPNCSTEVDGCVYYPSFDACIITVGTTHMEPFSEVGRRDMARVIEGSLILPLECARRYVQDRMTGAPLRKHGETVAPHHSTIIFVGSYAQDHPFTHCTTYCAAKAGLNMAVQSLAWELMPEGFHVHIINPHHVQGTPMTDEVRKGMQSGVHKMTAEEAEAYSRKDLRMPDTLKPGEIAEMVHLILDNPTLGWLSGQPINMYGGVR